MTNSKNWEMAGSRRPRMKNGNKCTQPRPYQQTSDKVGYRTVYMAHQSQCLGLQGSFNILLPTANTYTVCMITSRDTQLGWEKGPCVRSRVLRFRFSNLPERATQKPPLASKAFYRAVLVSLSDKGVPDKYLSSGLRLRLNHGTGAAFSSAYWLLAWVLLILYHVDFLAADPYPDIGIGNNCQCSRL